MWNILGENTSQSILKEKCYLKQVSKWQLQNRVISIPCNKIPNSKWLQQKKDSPSGVTAKSSERLSFRPALTQQLPLLRTWFTLNPLALLFHGIAIFLQQAFFIHPKYLSVTLEAMYFLINVQQEKEHLGISLPSKGTKIHSARLSVVQCRPCQSLQSKGAKMLISPIHTTWPSWSGPKSACPKPPGFPQMAIRGYWEGAKGEWIPRNYSASGDHIF